MPLGPRGRVAVLGLLLGISVLATTRATPPSLPAPPTQPATGPGGAAIAFARVVATHLTAPAPGAWLFAPADPQPGTDATAALPVVLVLGGCCMPDDTGAVAAFYRVWIDHLVRRGNVVVYPTYRVASAAIDVVNAVRAVAAAAGRPPADWSRLTVVGHSYGGVLAADYAATAPVLALPIPQALVLAMPGCRGCALPTNLAGIATTTRVLVLVGIADTVVGSADARALWDGLTQVPRAQRDFVTVWSDHHGAPALIADHALPTTAAVAGAAGVLDALDWYGTWKLTDALMACTFADRDCGYALGNTPEQRFMGTWSDGVPVAPLRITEDPGTPTPP